MGAKKVPDPSGRFPVRGTCSVSRPVVHLTIIGGWEAVMRLLRSVWRFCMKYRTTPRGPAVFQASLYEISYNSKRSVRFPSDYVRNIVQLQAVRPFSKRLCTKYRTTPRGPAVFQAILYEISYNSTWSGIKSKIVCKFPQSDDGKVLPIMLHHCEFGTLPIYIRQAKHQVGS